MKKVLAIALVAILVASSAFATFSGNATIGVGANFDNGEYGFITKSTNVQFNVDLATASAEKISEGDVYASIKATLGVFVLNDADGTGTGDPLSFVVVTGANKDSEKPVGLVLKATIDEAKVAGENWYLSLLGVPSVNDFAKSALDSWTVEDELDDYGIPKADYTDYATYKVGYQKAPGVEVGLFDYVVGFGFKADANKANGFEPFAKYAATVYGKTPEYTLVDGLKLQAGASYAISDGSYTDDPVNAVGGSVKVSYVADALSTSVASDFGYDFDNKDFGVDVAANVAYDFLTVDTYYAKSVEVDGTATDHLLSAQVKTDLNSFNVPVALTVTMKDIIAKQNLSLKAEVKPVDGLKVTLKGGYIFDDQYGRVGAAVNTDKHDWNGKWSTGADVEYAFDLFTVKGGFSLSQKLYNDSPIQVGASASIETTTLIPGATLKLAWAGDDLTDKVDGDHDNGNFGKLVASCKISF